MYLLNTIPLFVSNSLNFYTINKQKLNPNNHIKTGRLEFNQGSLPNQRRSGWIRVLGNSLD
jgi:hypothetical protein